MSGGALCAVSVNYTGWRSSHFDIRTLRALARNMTSKASPASGTRPTTPSTATLPSIRAVMCHGAPSARASTTSHSEIAVVVVSPATGIGPIEHVDAVTDIGAGQDEGDVEQFGDGVEPRQPLLPRQVGERIGAGLAEVEAKGLELRPHPRIRNFVAVLVDHGPTACIPRSRNGP